MKIWRLRAFLLGTWSFCLPLGGNHAHMQARRCLHWSSAGAGMGVGLDIGSSPVLFELGHHWFLLDQVIQMLA